MIDLQKPLTEREMDIQNRPLSAAIDKIMDLKDENDQLIEHIVDVARRCTDYKIRESSRDLLAAIGVDYETYGNNL